jgi:hypothetical protein
VICSQIDIDRKHYAQYTNGARPLNSRITFICAYYAPKDVSKDSDTMAYLNDSFRILDGWNWIFSEDKQCEIEVMLKQAVNWLVHF